MTDREKLPSGDVERVADAIEAVMGPVFGSPEYLADPVKLARAEKRRRDGALAYARAALSAMPDRQAGINEGLEMAAKVAEGMGADRIERNEDGSLRSYDMNCKHQRGDAVLNAMRVRAQTIANAIRAMKVEK